MAELVFYTNPMSRGRIIRWMLEEVGEPYETVILDYSSTMKATDYLAINPMGKVPAITHKGRVVTEAAAICAFLADVYPQAGLGPRDEEKADYYRWLFYAAGPVEQAVTHPYAKWDPAPEQGRMFGYGNYETVVDVIDELFSGRDYVCGDRFTAADVYVGSQIMFPMQFKMLPEKDSFLRYRDRLTAREAYRRGTRIDDDAHAQQQPAQQQPA